MLFQKRWVYNPKISGEKITLLPLTHSLANVSTHHIERICFSTSKAPVVYGNGDTFALEQLDIPFSVLKEVSHCLSRYKDQTDDVWDKDFGFLPIVQAMKILRNLIPRQVELLWWSKDKWITLETLIANKMDNPWMQFPRNNKVDLVSLEDCFLPNDQSCCAYWPEYAEYAHGIFATLDDLMIDAVFGKNFSGEYMSFDRYDYDCSNDHAFIDRNLAMFERVLNAVHSKTDQELLSAVGSFPESYFIPTESELLRESLIDYLQFVIQKINETKAKGWHLAFVGY